MLWWRGLIRLTEVSVRLTSPTIVVTSVGVAEGNGQSEFQKTRKAVVYRRSDTPISVEGIIRGVECLAAAEEQKPTVSESAGL